MRHQNTTLCCLWSSTSPGSPVLPTCLLGLSSALSKRRRGAALPWVHPEIDLIRTHGQEELCMHWESRAIGMAEAQNGTDRATIRSLPTRTQTGAKRKERRTGGSLFFAPNYCSLFAVVGGFAGCNCVRPRGIYAARN